jgi:hypothetical protein
LFRRFPGIFEAFRNLLDGLQRLRRRIDPLNDRPNVVVRIQVDGELHVGRKARARLVVVDLENREGGVRELDACKCK